MLRKYRQERGWTQNFVANQIGVTQTAIHDIETGKRIGSIPVWDALEDLFGIPQRQLRGKVGAATPNNDTPGRNRADYE